MHGVCLSSSPALWQVLWTLFVIEYHTQHKSLQDSVVTMGMAMPAAMTAAAFLRLSFASHLPVTCLSVTETRVYFIRVIAQASRVLMLIGSPVVF